MDLLLEAVESRRVVHDSSRASIPYEPDATNAGLASNRNAEPCNRRPEGGRRCPLRLGRVTPGSSRPPMALSPAMLALNAILPRRAAASGLRALTEASEATAADGTLEQVYLALMNSDPHSRYELAVGDGPMPNPHPLTVSVRSRPRVPAFATGRRGPTSSHHQGGSPDTSQRWRASWR
jgi:hypothetical protein